MKFHYIKLVMSGSSHHKGFVDALKAHWLDAGGPVSLTSFLWECRPTIAPLLEKGVSWNWLGPRVLAVFEEPDGSIEDGLTIADGRKKTLIELYSRSARRARAKTGAGRANPADENFRQRAENSGNLKPLSGQAKTEKVASATCSQVSDVPAIPPESVGATPHGTFSAGADPPIGRRARIRQSSEVRLKLDQ